MKSYPPGPPVGSAENDAAVVRLRAEAAEIDDQSNPWWDGRQDHPSEDIKTEHDRAVNRRYCADAGGWTALEGNLETTMTYTITTQDGETREYDRVEACDKARQEASEILATSCVEAETADEAIEYVRDIEDGEYSPGMLMLVEREIERQMSDD